jgi:hypothetical protein
MGVVEISTRRAEVRQALSGGADGGGEVPLADRLALVLADIMDEPLVTLASDGEEIGLTYRPLQLRLRHFKPELAELAATLLEEAGF